MINNNFNSFNNFNDFNKSINKNYLWGIFESSGDINDFLLYSLLYNNNNNI